MNESSLSTRRIQLGAPAHASFQRGVTAIVEAVRPTLGPLPRVVGIDRPSRRMTSELLDSGAVIARRITEIADRQADPGAMYLRGLLWRIHDEVGDGTATAAVLFDAVYREGRRAIAAGVPAQRLRTQLERGVDLIAAEIDRQARPISDTGMIGSLVRSVAHDDELAALITEVIDIAGAHGQIDLRDAHGAASRYELVEGAYWESGLLSDALLGTSPDQRLDLVDAVVLLTDLDLTDPAPLVPVLEHAVKTNAGGILITASSLSAAVTAFLVTNSRALRLPIAVVKLPGLTADDRRVALDDLEIMAGARALRATSGDRLERSGSEILGGTRRGWATRRQFGIIGGSGEAKALRHHVAALASQLDRTADAEDRAVLLARLGKFHRGSATLSIGGASETEQKFRHRAAERTINLLRRSLSAGTVLGGGTSLIHCQPAIDREFCDEHPEYRWARRILSRALQAPAEAIIENAGYEAPGIVNQLCSNRNLVFDALSGITENRCTSRIVDPAFVVREVAIRAIRSAALALTIDTIVHTNRSDISVNPE